MFLKKINFTVLALSAILIFTASCKSVKTAKNSTANLRLSAKQLILENTRLTPVFNTLQSKLKITYSDGKKEQTHTVSLRIKKDEVIWINAPFSIIRAKITPKNIAFYNKLDKTYFKGDYKYLSDLLGTNLDFNKVQNLLLGEAIFNLKTDNYKVFIHQDKYALQPKKQRELFELFYIINPDNYKINSQQLSQVKTLKHLQIDYKSYQDVANQSLPEIIKILALEGDKQTIIGLEIKSVNLNANLRYPFNIPNGFNKIKL